MLHKLAGGLEVAVANGAERSQGLFGQLRNGRRAQWAVAGAASPGAACQGPVDATSHLKASGVLPPVSGLGLELSHSAISRLCSTEHRQTQDGMVDGNRDKTVRRQRGQVPEDPMSPEAECRVRWCLAHTGQMRNLKPREET